MFKKILFNQKISLLFLLLILAALPVFTQVAKKGIKSRSSKAALSYNFGKALQLDGATYLDVTNGSQLNPSLGYTVEAWFKPDNTNYYAHIVTKMVSGQYLLDINVNTQFDYTTNTYKVAHEFNIKNSGNSCRQALVFYRKEIPASTPEAVTAWSHVAGVVLPDGTMKFFVNGEEATYNTNAVTDTCKGTAPVTVGAFRFDNGSPSGFLRGQIDELRISNTARYQTSFTPATQPFTPDANTILLYHFDSTTLDSSGNGYEGVIFGNTQYVDSTIPAPATPTPTPSSVIIQNSATGKSCDIVCGESNLSCVSIGTDIEGTNSSFWQTKKNACTQTNGSCKTVMKKTSKKYCSNVQSPWANCRCQ